mmetsp:Transcript_12158/g.23105  ORF Transcript_12158/g.23105 Transcript_12158/m.23105 type:complete len:201 (+) Transcript_12158:1735-2337(+)
MRLVMWLLYEHGHAELRTTQNLSATYAPITFVTSKQRVHQKCPFSIYAGSSCTACSSEGANRDSSCSLEPAIVVLVLSEAVLAGCSSTELRICAEEATRNLPIEDRVVELACVARTGCSSGCSWSRARDLASSQVTFEALEGMAFPGMCHRKSPVLKFPLAIYRCSLAPISGRHTSPKLRGGLISEAHNDSRACAHMGPA